MKQYDRNKSIIKAVLHPAVPVILICVLLFWMGTIVSANDWEPDVSKTWGPDLMNLPKTRDAAQTAYDQGVLTDTLLIAVIDTGINTSHEVFAGRISENSRSFLNGHDPDDFEDENGHGTNVAGIIVANTSSNIKLLILQALDEQKRGSAEDIADAIRYAVEKGADIINLSFATSLTETGNEALYNDYAARIEEALRLASEAGIYVIASAGNKGLDMNENGVYPAVSEYAITVSAAAQDLTLCEESNFGDGIDYCAPGENIWCPAIGGTDAYEYAGATSMAAPLISAAFALTKFSNTAMTQAELRECMEQTLLLGNDPSRYGAGLPVLNLTFQKQLPEQPILELIEENDYSITLRWDAIDGVSYNVYKAFDYRNIDYTLIATVEGDHYQDDFLVTGPIKLYYIEAAEDGYYNTKGSNIVSTSWGIPLDIVTAGENDPKVQNNTLLLQTGDTVQLALSNLPEGYQILNPCWYLWTFSISEGDIAVSSDVAVVDENNFLTVKEPGSFTLAYRSGQYYCSNGLSVVVQNEKCGADLYWQIEESGDETVLYISGSGPMYDFTYWDQALEFKPPWNDRKNEITKVVIGDQVTTIGDSAFFMMNNLKSVEGMKKVERIGSYAFDRCAKLESVELGNNLKEIRSSAFSYCAKLVRADLPEGLTAIRDCAFWECWSLKDVVIPESIETMESGAFGHGSLNSFTFPNSMTDLKIVKETLSWDMYVKEYKVKEGNECLAVEDGVLFNKDKTVLIQYPTLNEREQYVVPMTVREIGENAFEGANNLREIILPDGLETLDSYAVFLCENLKRLTIPANVSTLGYGAVSSCRNLEELCFEEPSKLVTIQGDFINCSIHSVVLPEGLKKMDHVAFLQNPLTSLTIPSGFIGFENDTIEIFADANEISLFESLTDVYYSGFTSGYQKIEVIECKRAAFLNVPNLHICVSGTCAENLTWKAEGLSGELTLTISGSGAMDDFTPTTMPWYEGRDEITRIIIEDGVTYVGSYAFYQMKNVGSIRIPAGIEGYGVGAIGGMSGLEFFEYAKGEEIFRIRSQYLEAVYQEIDGNPVTFEPQIMVTKISNGNAENTERFSVAYADTTLPGQGMICITLEDCEDVTVRLPFTVYDQGFEGVNIKRISIMTLSASSFTYNGSVQKPAVRVRSGNFSLRENIDYRLSYSPFSPVKTGTYRITATGIGAYTGILTKQFTISAKPIAGASVTGVTARTYTGSRITQSPRVTLGGRTLKAGTDYAISYTNNQNAGNAVMKITGIGNYNGSLSKTFRISPVPLSKAKVSKITDQAWSKNAIKPLPAVKYGTITLKRGKDYTLAYKNNKKVGKATVIITGKGNCTGSITKTFKINPKAVAVSSLKTGKRQITVNWEPQTAQRCAYEIQYSASSDFKNVKSVKVASSAAKTRTISRLISGQTCYVRIRAYKNVGGATYRSEWSPRKKATVK